MNIPPNSKNIYQTNNSSKINCKYPYEIYSKKYFEYCKNKCLEKSDSLTKTTNKIDLITNVDDNSLNKVYIDKY